MTKRGRPTYREAFRLREQDKRLLLLVAHGLTVAQMAREFGIPYYTMKSRLDRLRELVYARDVAHLMGQAYRLGLLDAYPTSLHEQAEEERSA